MAHSDSSKCSDRLASVYQQYKRSRSAQMPIIIWQSAHAAISSTVAPATTRNGSDVDWVEVAGPASLVPSYVAQYARHTPNIYIFHL